VDAAPLGYLSIAAHGHADALAFVLSVGGHALLIDPGTYAYHTQERWRDYFKGTSAHNTVRVDGVDQSVSGGKFMWLKHAKARCLSFQPERSIQEWRGSHDGYERLSDPVKVERALRYDSIAGLLEVADRIEATATHEVETFWHFAPECSVTRVDDKTLRVTNGPVSLQMSFVDAGVVELYSQSEQPILGWVSEGFDHKRGTVTARTRCSVQGVHTLRAILQWSID
jgi:uncharacterized heparinase superfamily protein